MGEKVGAGWESSPMPILCETCLGPNPYVRMTQDPAGGACKICERPFTVYRWKPGPKARFKKTELCQMCARVKNVCQTCIFDLQYGLPVEVRDSILAKAASRLGGAAGASAALALTSSTAAGGGGQMSDVNRQYALAQAERSMAEGGATSLAPFGGVPGGAASVLPEAHAALVRASRTQPYYERNAAKLCSFFAKGECTRGDLCPYRHEMPRDKADPLARQNMLDRYHGSNDPLAAKLLGRMEARASAPPPPPPADASIRTLWVSGLDERIGEEELRGAFAPHGAVSRVRLNHAKGCAFVELESRASAEAAVAALHGGIVLAGMALRVSWAKPRERQGGGGGGGGAAGGGGGRGGEGGAASGGASTAAAAAAAAAPALLLNYMAAGGADSGSSSSSSSSSSASAAQPPSGVASWASQAAQLSFAPPPPSSS